MKLSKPARRLSAIVTAIAVLALGVASTADARPDVSGDLLTPGTLLVGSDIPYPPFEFGTAPNFKGFDVDLVNALAKKLDLKVKIKDTPFDTIFTDTKRHKFDLAASATTITPFRKLSVNFSKPYYDGLQSLVVRRGSTIKSLKGLAGAVVGVRSGTSGEAFARSETDAAKVVRFANGTRTIQALKSGRVDAVVIDQPTAQDYLAKREHRDLKTVRMFSVGELYGLAISKDSPKLLRGINWAFDKIKADGQFRRMYRKWFGIAPPPSLRG